MRPFTDLISLSLLIRFSPSTLFVAEQITRSSENLSFIITRNICANDIFLSLQASTVLLVSISRLKKPVCSFESDEMETGFLSGNPEAFISRNFNEPRRGGKVSRKFIHRLEFGSTGWPNSANSSLTRCSRFVSSSRLRANRFSRCFDAERLTGIHVLRCVSRITRFGTMECSRSYLVRKIDAKELAGLIACMPK